MIINTRAYEWLIWGVSRVPTGDLTLDESARIEAGRERANGLVATTEEIALRWKNDSTLHRRFVGNGYRLWNAWRHYATFEFADRQVDIEVFSAIGGGPGFAFKDVRLYLDGLVVGRAWCGACSLGFGGGGGPAIAMLRDEVYDRSPRRAAAGHATAVHQTGRGGVLASRAVVEARPAGDAGCQAALTRAFVAKSRATSVGLAPSRNSDRSKRSVLTVR